MKIKITYTGGIDRDLDRKILDFFEGLGFVWTGQGIELENHIRDIAFEKVEEVNAANEAQKIG